MVLFCLGSHHQVSSCRQRQAKSVSTAKVRAQEGGTQVLQMMQQQSIALCVFCIPGPMTGMHARTGSHFPLQQHINRSTSSHMQSYTCSSADLHACDKVHAESGSEVDHDKPVHQTTMRQERDINLMISPCDSSDSQDKQTHMRQDQMKEWPFSGD